MATEKPGPAITPVAGEPAPHRDAKRDPFTIDAKAIASKTVDAKPADAKRADAVPGDAKPADAKPADAKPGDAGAFDTKAARATPHASVTGGTPGAPLSAAPPPSAKPFGPASAPDENRGKAAKIDAVPPDGTRPRPDTLASAEKPSSARAPGRVVPAAALTLAVVALVVAIFLAWQFYGTLQPAAGTTESALAALQARVATLESRPVAASPAPTAAPGTAALAALAERLTTDETTLKTLAAGNDAARAEAARALAAAGARPAAATAAATNATADVTALDSRVGALETALAPLAANAVSKTDLQSVSTQVAAGTAQAHTAVTIVAATALLDALDRGAPIGPEIDALKSVGVTPAALTPLTVFAQPGAPTAAVLAREFAALEAKIRDAHAAAPAPTGLLDRLSQGALGLVDVRPVGAPTGDDPDAIVGRIAHSLALGDIAAALADWDKLPAAGKAVSQAFAQRARARLDADGAAHAILNDALVTLVQQKT